MLCGVGIASPPGSREGDCFVVPPRNDSTGARNEGDCFVVPPRNDSTEARNDGEEVGNDASGDVGVVG